MIIGKIKFSKPNRKLAGGVFQKAEKWQMSIQISEMPLLLNCALQ
jgi:hypothetical protein